MFRYRTEEEVIEAGERFDRAEYWGTVRSIAEEAHRAYPDDEEAQDRYLDESVDGNAYIIYTRQNLKVLLHTEHDDAYLDFGEVPAGKDAYELYAFLAFHAMRADVMAELVRIRDEKAEEE